MEIKSIILMIAVISSMLSHLLVQLIINSKDIQNISGSFIIMLLLGLLVLFVGGGIGYLGRYLVKDE